MSRTKSRKRPSWVVWRTSAGGVHSTCPVSATVSRAGYPYDPRECGDGDDDSRTGERPRGSRAPGGGDRGLDGGGAGGERLVRRRRPRRPASSSPAARGLLDRLPSPPRRTDGERAAAQAIAEVLNGAREAFMRAHVAEDLYAAHRGMTRPLRDEQLAYEAAERFPGLTPTRAAMAAELQRKLGEKRGLEIAQGLFLAHVLASPRAGSHLVHTMLRPTAEALERLDDFRATGRRRPRPRPRQPPRPGRGSSSCATRATSTPRTTPRSRPPSARRPHPARSRDRGRGPARRRGRPSALPGAGSSAPGST